MSNNDYEIIKKSVDEAKIQSASIAGEVKGKIESLSQLGFKGNNIVNDANEYLDKQEGVLDNQEKTLQSKKQKISDRYQEIIKTTAPGTDPTAEAQEHHNLAMPEAYKND